jgi:hypothetical protein
VLIGSITREQLHLPEEEDSSSPVVTPRYPNHRDRFVTHRRSTSPVNACPKITRYTRIILEGLRNATALIIDPTNKERHQQHSGFVQKINHDLIQLLSPPPKCTTPFRRFLIEDSFRLTALIYLSIVPKVVIGGQINCEVVLEHVRLKLIDSSTDWGGTIEMILKLLIAGGNVRSQQNVYYVVQLMDLLLPLNWSVWKFVRNTLLDFLLHAEVCSGVHQDLWLCRIDI